MRNAVIAPLIWRAIADSWRSLAAWAVGLSAALFLYLPLYPSIGGNGQMQQLLSSLPPELVKTLGYEDIASGAGYTQATFFGLIGFLLLVVAATSWGSAAIAGAEESGALELTLAHGVSRAQWVISQAVAVLLRLVVLAALSFVIIVLVNTPAQLGIDVAHLVAALAALTGLAYVSGAVALVVGAATGRRVVATAAGAGIAVIGYVFNAIANQVAGAEWLRSLSPYSWAFHDAPLRTGVAWGSLGLIWGLALVAAAGALVALRRRDISG